MKKDILVPEVEGIFLAIAYSYNPAFKTEDWNVYLINEKTENLETVLIVSNGFDNELKTATLRHKLENLPAKSGAKIELLQREVLQLNNLFQITFFINNQLYEKSFLIKKDSVNKDDIKDIGILGLKGILFS